MRLFSEFKTDSSLESKGVEFTYTDGHGNPVFQLRLARAGGSNKRYDQVKDTQMAVYRKTRELSPEVIQKVARRTFAEACALPGTWKFMEYAGMRCDGNTCVAVLDEEGKPTAELKREPETPKRRLPDGWVKGIENSAGDLVPDTIDAIDQVLESLPDLYIRLAQESVDFKTYQADLEDDAKN